LGVVQALQKSGLDELVYIVEKTGLVEVIGDWSGHVDELGLFLSKLAENKHVHVVFYGSSKFVDLLSFYNKLEPYLSMLENVAVIWENSVEALIYHTLLLGKNRGSALVLIFPHDKHLNSQIENTYLHKLRSALIEAHKRGWVVIVINPVRRVPNKTHNKLAKLTLYVDFSGDHVSVNTVENVSENELLVLEESLNSSNGVLSQYIGVVRR